MAALWFKDCTSRFFGCLSIFSWIYLSTKVNVISLFRHIRLIFLNCYEHFLNSIIFVEYIPLSDQKNMVWNCMMNLATTILALGLLALPFIFVWNVRLRVSHALKNAVGKWFSMYSSIILDWQTKTATPAYLAALLVENALHSKMRKMMYIHPCYIAL